MDEKEKQILKSIIEKKRSNYELTAEEQRLANEWLGKLLDKKCKNQVFIVKTGDQIRKDAALAKAAGKPKDVQPEAAIAKERSEFGKKPAKIENDDTSGAVKATEEGEYVNVDEKRVGGKDSAENEAKHENASDIIDSDKEDLQRKPVLKLGDVVIKTLNGKKYAGVVVKYYADHGIAQVKWANMTFSNCNASDLEIFTKAYEAEKAKIEVPKTDTGKKDVKTPGTDTAEEHVGLKPAAVKKAAEDDVQHDESKETPEEEAAETPEEQAAEAEAGTEEQPAEGKDYENTWMARCMKSASENPDVEKAESLCRLAYGKVAKSSEGTVRLTKEEIATDNPKLAKSMEAAGHSAIVFETKLDKKS